jgi:ParB family chromosome partitioning protein
MTRRPLGRGLDALISTDTVTTTEPNGHAEARDDTGISAPVLMIPPDHIVMSRFQPRQIFEEEALQELAAAIKTQGIIEPLIVRPLANGEFELVAGERRLRASRIAKLEKVPVIVRQLDDREALELSLVENLLRENLNPVEEGKAFARLNQEFGLTHEQIASRIGKSRAYVSNMIRLTELPAPILEMVNKGVLTAGQVRPLLALHSVEEQLKQARFIAERRLSARDAEQLAAKQRPVTNHTTNSSNRQPDFDPNLHALRDSIQRALKRKVRIISRRGKCPGRIELEYYSDEDLTSLATMLVRQSSSPFAP